MVDVNGCNIRSTGVKRDFVLITINQYMDLYAYTLPMIQEWCTIFQSIKFLLHIKIKEC